MSVFSAVDRRRYETLRNAGNGRVRIGLGTIDGCERGSNHGVAGDDDARRVDTFTLEVAAAQIGGRSGRRRWYQGHMTAGKQIGQVWTEPSLSHGRALEISAYLAVPWLFDLPWSILWHWTIVNFILRADSVFSWATSVPSAIIGGVAWYALTFAPSIFTSIVYYRRDARTGWPTAILMGHAFLVMNYLSFVCAWGALFRMIRGKTGWDKTARVAESPAAPPVVTSASAPVVT